MSRNLRVAVLGLCVAACFSLVYYRAVSHWQLATFSSGDVVFGADSDEAVFAIHNLTFEGDMRKHVLYSFVMSSLRKAVAGLYPTSEPQSIVLTLTVVAALNFTLAFLVLIYYLGHIGRALLFTILYGFWFSCLVVFAIPETYVVTNLAILLFAFQMLRYRRRPNRLQLSMLALACALAALLNPPLLSLIAPGCVLLWSLHDRRQFAARASVLAALSVGVFVFVSLAIHGWELSRFYVDYADEWASLENLLDPGHVLNTSSSFLLYTAVRPMDRIDGPLAMDQYLGGTFSSPVGALLSIVYLTLLFHALAREVRRRSALSIAWCLWIVLMILFYTYFNPHESLLYCAQVAFPLILVLAGDSRAVRLGSREALIALFASLLIWHNTSGLSMLRPERQTEAQVLATLERDLPDLMAQERVPGLAVALLRDGGIAWVRGFGTDQRVDAETVFGAEDLTKPALAYVTLRLSDAGRIDLDAPLTTYLQHAHIVDPRRESITARMVMSHTSGIPDRRSRDRRARSGLSFDPGTRYQYSDEGFVYLERVLEHITGKDIHELLREELFEPIGMTRTNLAADRLVLGNRALPHRGDGTGYDESRIRRRAEASSLRTTAGDYARFVSAVLNGEGLTPESSASMLSSHSRVDDGLAWGLGWSIQEPQTGRFIWLFGVEPGYQALAMAFLERNSGMVLLTNSDNGLRLARPVAEIIFDTDHHPALDALGYHHIYSD